jgi:hypothetical protein
MKYKKIFIKIEIKTNFKITYIKFKKKKINIFNLIITFFFKKLTKIKSNLI